MSFKKTPRDLMLLAIEEAQKGGRRVRPNPQVGCAVETLSGEVLVSYHAQYGEAHAERRMIDLARSKALSLKGARVAVTLEPCSHFGKTPPCADALIQEDISELFVGSEDPFVQVKGRGLKKIEAAGIKVESNLMRVECEALNEAWLFAHRHQRARLTLKMATSLDGAWASENGTSKWITSEKARKMGQTLRSRVDALVSGFSTLRHDNPSLTARGDNEALFEFQPRVIILSKSEKFDSLKNFKVAAHPGGVELVNDMEPLKLLKDLYAKGFYDVMLEAGPTLSQLFLEAACVDEVWHFMDTQFLGGASLGWGHSFNSGKLPGHRLNLCHLEQLDETSIFMKLKASLQ